MRPNEAKLTLEMLKHALDYNPETGVFTWKNKISCKNVVGEVAGGNDNGYVRISLYRQKHMAHRLAWFYVHGIWPDEEVDHVNMDRSDNRICNLRPANKEQNSRNRHAQVNNKVGLKGVCEHAQQPGKYTAQIGINNKKKHLGIFTDPLEAHKAYVKASSELHQKFGRTS